VRFNGGALIPGPDADSPASSPRWRPTWTALGLYLGWFGLQAALQAWAPGPVVDGTELPQGGRLRYRMNGRAALLITLLLTVAGTWSAAGLDPATLIYDQFGRADHRDAPPSPTCFAAFLYVVGPAATARPATSPAAPVHDFWMGTGHNPRLPRNGLFDLKFFCEARPGLLLWVLIDLSARRRRAPPDRQRERGDGARLLRPVPCTSSTTTCTSPPSSPRWTSSTRTSGSCSRSATWCGCR
jgi:hypothetical protein